MKIALYILLLPAILSAQIKVDTGGVVKIALFIGAHRRRHWSAWAADALTLSAARSAGFGLVYSILLKPR